MHISLSIYRRKTGWFPPLPADLDSPQTLVLVFGDSAFVEEPAPFLELADRFVQAVHAGCSSGPVHGACGWRPGELTAAIIRFQDTHLHGAAVEVRQRRDSGLMGAALAAQLPSVPMLRQDRQAAVAPLQRQGPLRLALLLSDGQGVDGEALLRGLRGGLPLAARITGGLAGDRGATGPAWVYGCDGRLPAPGRACVVGLYGPRLHVGQGHAAGWQPMGMAHHVTRAHGPVVYELDGRPALEVYRDYLGTEAARLPASALLHPLALTAADGQAPTIRSVLTVDEHRGALLLATSLAEGSRVLVMQRQAGDLAASTRQAAERAVEALPPGARHLLLSVGCLDQPALPGADGTLAEAPPAMPWPLSLSRDALPAVGFHSLGELTAGAAPGEVQLHHQTHAFTALAEA
ncbi:FIST C-terminal domain-containing protein [Aquincola tertiaricarbonis]|uniref:FIST C-terminal domain-containing protein n=1 Tax=Aquincola tertiaricarbonis TaxID=391953 RepID=A0ABY4SEF1_AQUTE|nr:FIST N-terminal domain-containing protein [Aquincola tertiaricarbonis]URI10945.1 FIST C-terminal domain-containing protein [Aquincola tertiaricarbonis]